MKKITPFLLAAGILSAVACNQSQESEKDAKVQTETKVEKVQKDPKATEKIEAQTLEATTIDSLVSLIDDKRREIESTIGEGISLSTENMRAKVKQKWEKLHFYTLNDQLVRIKTYPYAEISKRTEEFYLQDGELILAVIEDNGEGERGKSNENIDKLYYFYKGNPLKEVHVNEKAEYTIKNLDFEELQAEVKEYVEAYQNQQNSI
jgi:hypothetical protein